MRHDLYQLLEQHPASRQLVRHLDLVERTLRRGGLEALEALPIRVITKALAQLENHLGEARRTLLKFEAEKAAAAADVPVG